MTSVAPEELRAAMRRWATGVTVVTTHHRGEDAGLTVNSFLSVALTPPIVLVSLTHDADSLPLLEGSGRFAISVLAADQQAVSERFAQAVPSPRKFEGLPFHRGLADVPLIDGAIVHIECRRRSTEVVEDHRLVLGDVERIGGFREAMPLLFLRSRYVVPDAAGAVTLPGERPGPASSP